MLVRARKATRVLLNMKSCTADHSCMFAFWSLVAGAAAQYCCRMPLQGACVRVQFALWNLVAAGFYCKVLLSECCVHFGAGLLLSLQGCRYRAPLQGAAFRVLLPLWSLLAAGDCCKALLSECCLRFGRWLLVRYRVLQDVLQCAAGECSCWRCCGERPWWMPLSLV